MIQPLVDEGLFFRRYLGALSNADGARAWVDVPEDQLREGLLLCFRAHCHVIGEPCGEFCREGFAEFDAVLAADGIAAARDWAWLRFVKLYCDRGARWKPPVMNIREMEAFWRKLCKRQNRPPTAWEQAIMGTGLVADTERRGHTAEERRSYRNRRERGEG